MAWNFTTPELDIDYTRGDDHSLPLHFTLGGADRDFTGWTSLLMAVHSVATPVDDTSKVLELAGTLDGDPTTGILFFTPASTTDTDLPPTVYFYDAQGIDVAGKKTTLVKGKFRLNQDRTKD